MIRKFKAMGIALVAVFALTAVVASAAQAASFHSESSSGNTILEGSQTTQNRFTVTNSSEKVLAEVHCSGAKFTGTQTGNTAEAVEAHPVYTGCEASPFGGATVVTTGCNYNLHASGTTDIVCGTGHIAIEAPGCTINVASQTGLSSVSYANSGSPSEITVTANVKNIHFTSSGALCALFSVPSSGTMSDYTGAVKVAGFVDTAGVKGAKTGISWTA